MEPLADAVGLGMVDFGPGMVDVLHRQVQLIGVVLGFPVILGAPVGEDALQLDALLVIEGENPVIEQVRRGDGALLSV